MSLFPLAVFMYRSITARIVAWSVLAVFVLPFLYHGTATITGGDNSPCAQEKGYISQTYIDTMIQQAFYQFHLAETALNPRKSQQRAIENAKQVVRKLRRTARGDENEKYILFKVSELEQHIYLEEKDLLLAKMKEGQKSLNQLINQYNAELAKNRPDFRMLVALHKQVGNIDIRKSNQIASSINQRNRNVAREIIHGIEKKMLTGDYAGARKDLDYCRSQQGYLNVSQSRCDQWEKNLGGIEKADLHRASISEQLKRAESLVANRSLSEAWRIIPGLQKSINSAENLSDRQAIDFRGRVGKLIQRIDHLEDSLFHRSVAILDQQGIDPAIEFMQTELSEYNVSRSCLMRVDSAIMAVAPQSRQSSGAISEELSNLVQSDQSNSSLTMETARDIAQRRAQAKMDSINAVEEEKARKAALEQARQDSIRLAELQERERKLRKYRVKAQKEMVRIVELLEKGKIKKAHKMFRRKQDPLSLYIEQNTYAMLKQTVVHAYQNRHKKKNRGKQRDIIVVARQKDQNKRGRSVSSQDQNSGGYEGSRSARVTATKESPRPGQPPAGGGDNAVSKSDTRRQASNSGGAAADNPAQGRQYSGQSEGSSQSGDQLRAQQIVIDIYTLLEANQVRQAYSRFDENRELMSREIGGEPYAMLEQTVMQSYQDLQEYLNNSSSSQRVVSSGTDEEHNSAPAITYDEPAGQNSHKEPLNAVADDTHDSSYTTYGTEYANGETTGEGAGEAVQSRYDAADAAEYEGGSPQSDYFSPRNAAAEAGANQEHLDTRSESANDGKDHEYSPVVENDYFSVEKAKESHLAGSTPINTQTDQSTRGDSSGLDRNQRKAQNYISHLYKLLEQNQVKKAYVRFQKIREPLEKYSDPVAFQTLESILLQSYQTIDAN